MSSPLKAFLVLLWICDDGLSQSHFGTVAGRCSELDAQNEISSRTCAGGGIQIAAQVLAYHHIHLFVTAFAVKPARIVLQDQRILVYDARPVQGIDDFLAAFNDVVVSNFVEFHFLSLEIDELDDRVRGIALHNDLTNHRTFLDHQITLVHAFRSGLLFGERELHVIGLQALAYLLDGVADNQAKGVALHHTYIIEAQSFEKLNCVLFDAHRVLRLKIRRSESPVSSQANRELFQDAHVYFTVRVRTSWPFVWVRVISDFGPFLPLWYAKVTARALSFTTLHFSCRASRTVAPFEISARLVLPLTEVTLLPFSSRARRARNCWRRK